MLGNCNGTSALRRDKIKQKVVKSNETKAMTTHHISQQRKEPPKCFQCGKYGHLNSVISVNQKKYKRLLLKGTTTQKGTYVTVDHTL